VDAYPQQTPWALCRDSCPANALEVVAREPAILASVVLPLRAVLTVVLLAAVTVALTLRWRAASHLRRHMLAPVVLAALVTLISLTGFVVVRLAAPGSAAVDTLGWLYGLSIPVIALSFLIGLLRWRLFVARALRQLAAEVGAQSGPSILGAAFRKRMEDPTLRLLWWDGPTARWADSTGAPADLDHERALGHVATEARDHQGLPLIALVTDGAFRDNAEVRDTLMRYAMNSLEHRRLERRLDESMRELDESRARYASVAVAERRRIERDLHDGAQQRLVAVRIRLELAAEAMERNPHSGAGLVRELGDQIEQALDEVRSVAHSVYPSVLADCGLQDALRSQARHAALPVGLDASGVGRYPPEIESAVYFTCLEAMQNAAKHARGATRIAVSLRQGADLRFEVADDGAGLPAGYLEGVGIANMRDRMADVGGSMTLESLAGQGTTVTGTVPLRRSHD
jgi:signal transduction histidine kinase